MTAATRLQTTTLPDVMIRRIYHAPRALVWRAWTDPTHLKEWYGPHFFTNATTRIDLKVGGELYLEMVGPDGARYPMTSIFQEIDEPERLVMLNRVFEDAKGEAQLETLTTVDFAEDRGRTILTVREHVLRAAPAVAGAVAGMEEGMVESLERLGGHLKSLVLAVPDDEPISVITRIFDASREALWKVMTDADHLKHWWGPRNMTTIHCEIDARSGGSWRIHQRYDGDDASPGGSPKGTVFKFLGDVREVVPPEKIVQTFGMEGMFEDQTIVETMTLTDLGNGKTLFKVVSRFEGVDEAAAFASRQGMVDSGMSYGAQETYDRLDEYLETI
jgi:uncharacterized protein YndB with AHSA1/START domain